jgi:iron complex transport system ATP-binding protein
MLHVGGFEVTTGVLSEGDTDLALARALSIEAVAIPAFTTIDEESHRRNLELVASADCTMVADVPFGQANLLNLEAAASAKRLVVIEETPIEQRDFTGGKAAILYRSLKRQASATTYDDLLSSVQEVLAGDREWPGARDERHRETRREGT